MVQTPSQDGQAVTGFVLREAPPSHPLGIPASQRSIGPSQPTRVRSALAQRQVGTKWRGVNALPTEKKAGTKPAFPIEST
jgi:hypothetical protein